MEEIIQNDSITTNNIINRHYYGLISSMHVYQNKYLLIGNGNILKIYILENLKLIFSQQIFESNKITKIKSFKIILKINEKDFDKKAEKDIILILAENEIKYIILNSVEIKIENVFENNNLNFQKIQNNNNDYILDIYLTQTNSENNCLNLIVGYVGNYIDIISTSINIIKNDFQNFYFFKRIFCPEKCIVYSMNIITEINSNNLKIASGTVFRKIVIWIVNLNNLHNLQNLNQLDLLGHEGVIFNLYFADEYNLISVSDDRTTRNWELKKEKQNEINYTSTAYTGHTARVWEAKINLKNQILISVGEDCNLRIYDLKTKKFIKELSGFHIGKNIRCMELNDDFIITAGEDWQIFKWNLHEIINNKNNNNINNLDLKIIESISENNDQFLSAKIKEKNFRPAVKFIKFLNENFVLIGTNHGQVIKYNINKKQIKNIIFSDNLLRVINSIEIINLENNFYMILIGLSDGSIKTVIYNLNEEVVYQNNFQIFNNIRVTFISHKILYEDLILIISNPIGVSKIFFIKNINNNLKFNLDNFLLLNTGAKSPLPISSIEIIKIKSANNINFNNINKGYLLFLGDSNGNLYFTNLKLINDKLFNFFELKFIKIHTDKITQITQNIEENFDFNSNYNNKYIINTSARDGKYKKLLIFKELNKFTNQFAYTVKEIDFKFRNDITSLEKFNFIKNNELLLIGHHGRNLVIFDYNKNSVFHTNDLGGVYRPMDIFINKNYITYCYSDAKNYFICKINNSTNNNYNKNFEVLNSPLHGRLIHSVKILDLLENNKNNINNLNNENNKNNVNNVINLNNLNNLNNKNNENNKNYNTNFKILVTGSEDTNANFYLLDFNNLNNLVYLEQFSKHSGAIRDIEIIDKREIIIETNNVNFCEYFYEFFIVTVASCSECFLFKFQIHVSFNKNNNNNNKNNNPIIKNHNLYFLSDLSIKQLNLETRIMAVNFSQIYSDKRIYLISYCNTTSKNENFIIDLDENQFNPICYKEIELNNSNFIPISFGLIKNKNMCNNLDDNFNLIEYVFLLGLTTGILYIKTLNVAQNKLNSDFSILDKNNKNINNLFKIHQAGINEIKCDSNSNLIFTCGEDNSISICHLNLGLNLDKSEYKFEVLRKIKYLHSSPIKSICFLNTCRIKNLIYLVTGGYDQKINVLEIIFGSEEKHNLLKNNHNNFDKILEIKNNSIKTCLAELNKVELTFNNDEDELTIISSGQGLEIFKYKI